MSDRERQITLHMRFSPRIHLAGTLQGSLPTHENIETSSFGQLSSIGSSIIVGSEMRRNAHSLTMQGNAYFGNFGKDGREVDLKYWPKTQVYFLRVLRNILFVCSFDSLSCLQMVSTTEEVVWTAEVLLVNIDSIPVNDASYLHKSLRSSRTKLEMDMIHDDRHEMGDFFMNMNLTATSESKGGFACHFSSNNGINHQALSRKAGLRRTSLSSCQEMPYANQVVMYVRACS